MSKNKVWWPTHRRKAREKKARAKRGVTLNELRLLGKK